MWELSVAPEYHRPCPSLQPQHSEVSWSKGIHSCSLQLSHWREEIGTDIPVVGLETVWTWGRVYCWCSHKEEMFLSLNFIRTGIRDRWGLCRPSQNLTSSPNDPRHFTILLLLIPRIYLHLYIDIYLEIYDIYIDIYVNIYIQIYAMSTDI